MEPADSSSPPEQNPVSSRNGDSETWFEGFNSFTMDRGLEERLINQIHESVSSIPEFSRQWEEYDKEMELKEISVKKLIQEQEERLKLVEERERKVGLMEASITERLSELQERLVLQMQNEQVVKKNEELMGEVEARKEELDLISKSINDKSCEFEMKVKDFDLKKTAETERMRKEAELVEISRKQLEVRESELSLLNETISEKSTELERKEENFQLKQQADAIEIEVKTKFLELKEKELEEKEKELELKHREFEKEASQAETRKRSRLQFESSQKETAPAVQASTSSPVQISETHEGETEEVVSIADSDEEPEQLNCVDSEFNDFTKKMSSFMVGQVWALYDDIDSMPRCYGRIKMVNKSRSRFQVTWIVPKDEDSVPVACRRFIWGITETIKGHLTFSHEMHPIIYGRNFISVNPKKGETWALFRDWSVSWNNNPEQHKPPYRYDFVEVLFNFDDQLGVGVAYLGKVEGFVSVFKHAAQHGVFSLMITPEEMNRFSHRVPSFRMIGNEKEGVPAGSFELDPAAIPNSILNRDHSLHEEAEIQEDDCDEDGEVEDEDGSREDLPIILD
ncbi:hypothetical protein V5N11_023683 [Cardamine amara subsp. amara]|uniref:DUF3444 domain-containing protein n=1 Tax=Cardamine amara subsp. amara TaxID=228776 RepID=A0ABD1AY68_CARAN